MLGVSLVQCSDFSDQLGFPLTSALLGVPHFFSPQGQAGFEQ
jgi:hypothetical protein